MNLSAITASRPRAVLVGLAAGLLIGLGATQAVVAIGEATHPGSEATPASETEKGSVLNPSAAGNLIVL